MALFGNGGAIAFTDATSTWDDWTTNVVHSGVGQFAQSVAVADVTGLAAADDTYRLKLASRRKEHEPITITYFAEIISAALWPTIGLQVHLDITFPTSGTDILDGDGFVTNVQDLGMADDEVMTGELEFQFKGGTTNPPTFTAT